MRELCEIFPKSVEHAFDNFLLVVGKTIFILWSAVDVTVAPNVFAFDFVSFTTHLFLFKMSRSSIPPPRSAPPPHQKQKQPAKRTQPPPPPKASQLKTTTTKSWVAGVSPSMRSFAFLGSPQLPWDPWSPGIPSRGMSWVPKGPKTSHGIRRFPWDPGSSGEMPKP